MTKVAIVTAAGRGIGAAIAKALAADGYTMALLSPGATVESLGRELGGFGMRGSVTESGDLLRLVEERHVTSLRQSDYSRVGQALMGSLSVRQWH